MVKYEASRSIGADGSVDIYQLNLLFKTINLDKFSDSAKTQIQSYKVISYFLFPMPNSQCPVQRCPVQRCPISIFNRFAISIHNPAFTILSCDIFINPFISLHVLAEALIFIFGVGSGLHQPWGTQQATYSRICGCVSRLALSQFAQLTPS
jgi:hypothetical protein